MALKCLLSSSAWARPLPSPRYELSSQGHLNWFSATVSWRDTLSLLLWGPDASLPYSNLLRLLGALLLYLCSRKLIQASLTWTQCAQTVFLSLSSPLYLAGVVTNTLAPKRHLSTGSWREMNERERRRIITHLLYQRKFEMSRLFLNIKIITWYTSEHMWYLGCTHMEWNLSSKHEKWPLRKYLSQRVWRQTRLSNHFWATATFPEVIWLCQGDRFKAPKGHLDMEMCVCAYMWVCVYLLLLFFNVPQAWNSFGHQHRHQAGMS